MKPKVVVMGGGYAGMAAAVVLSASGCQVNVFEAGKRLGGRARQVTWHGHHLDNGQHILLGAYTTLLGLMAFVDPDEHLALKALPLTWDMHGKVNLSANPLLGRAGTLLALLTAKGFNLRDKMGILSKLVQTRFSSRSAPDGPVSDWLRGQTDNSICYFWEPLCLAALNTPIHLASSRIFKSVILDGLLAGANASRMLLPKVNLSALWPEKAAVFVAKHDGKMFLAEKVKHLQCDADGFTLITSKQALSADAVVCAVGPHQLADLDLPHELSSAVDHVSAFAYQPIRTVYVQYAETASLPKPVHGLHHCIENGICHWVFDRGQLTGEHGLLAVVISAEHRQHASPKEELESKVIQELKAFFPELPTPLWAKSILETRATFQADVALPRPDGKTSNARFAFAGDYIESPYPATLESAARSGVVAANRLATTLGLNVPEHFKI
ncbi:hydroxysqualene dehydroxylase HpnE [Leeia oryzae]|uniref:hydroxysqualene dehydroxylase HpnE n=1 Tax=Leeia oryzae TaxID=356662 RepID=UPI0004778DE6|nr:hydroxysqualene dehydroxylase HpnE [Leeia oryzae]